MAVNAAHEHSLRLEFPLVALAPQTERDDEDKSDRKVADNSDSRQKETEDDEEHVTRQVRGQPLSQGVDLVIACVRPYELTPDGISPHPGYDKRDQEQVGSQDRGGDALGSAVVDVFCDQSCRKRQERDEQQQQEGKVGVSRVPATIQGRPAGGPSRVAPALL